MDYICLGTVCCLMPAVLGSILATIIAAIIRSRKKKFAVSDTIVNIWNWISIVTFRSLVTLFWAGVFAIIALSVKELSLFSTISVFLILMTFFFVMISFIFKIYLSIGRILPFNQNFMKSTINRKEIMENEAATINIKIATGIPLGFILKIREILPAKLGGDLRGIATSTEKMKTEFNATIPITRRGHYIIGPTHFQYQDIFGFSQVKVLDQTRFDLVIIPQIPQINRFDFKLSVDKGDENQEIQATLNTEDYFNPRPYVRGDDIRRIHWKLTAKTGELMIRQPETTTISFKNLLIIILNTTPRFSATSQNPEKSRFSISNALNANNPNPQQPIIGGTYPIPYSTAAEYALDTQVRIAAAVIDFSLRNHLPIQFAYFEKGKLTRFTPHIDDPGEWKRKLASINLENMRLDTDQIVQTIKEEKNCIITTSETYMPFFAPIISQAIESRASIEVMYSPVSTQMKKIAKYNKADKRSAFIKIIEKIFLTKPYFEQQTLQEKVYNLITKRDTKYSDNDILKTQEAERSVINSIGGDAINLRNFDIDDEYTNDIENIVNILENE